MGKKGRSGHLKRKPAPKFWPIHRKEKTWTVKPVPGPHPVEECIPLMLIVRDYLDLAETRREAEIIIKRGLIEVDGVVRKEPRFPVGLMDVVQIREVEKSFRVLPTEKGLSLHEIKAEEANVKLCRIENKTTVKGGYTQLNLHDGRNILIKDEEEAKMYKTLDTVMIEIPKQNILKHIKMGEGVYVIVTGGKNIGKHGKILEIGEVSGVRRRKYEVVLEDKSGEKIHTILDYIFALGEEEPLISLPD